MITRCKGWGTPPVHTMPLYQDRYVEHTWIAFENVEPDMPISDGICPWCERAMRAELAAQKARGDNMGPSKIPTATPEQKAQVAEGARDRMASIRAMLRRNYPALREECEKAGLLRQLEDALYAAYVEGEYSVLERRD